LGRDSARRVSASIRPTRRAARIRDRARLDPLQALQCALVIDAATHAAGADDYALAERELLSLKGKGVAVEAFRLRFG
jgi:hypothetical protein